MSDINKGASLPVESSSIKAELQAAFARIAEIPARETLVDVISSELWMSGVQGCIEAGDTSHDGHDLDLVDQEVKEIA